MSRARRGLDDISLAIGDEQRFRSCHTLKTFRHSRIHWSSATGSKPGNDYHQLAFKPVCSTGQFLPLAARIYCEHVSRLFGAAFSHAQLCRKPASSGEALTVLGGVLGGNTGGIGHVISQWRGPGPTVRGFFIRW